MKIIKLLEARRNPALNTKQEFQQFIDERRKLIPVWVKTLLELKMES